MMSEIDSPSPPLPETRRSLAPWDNSISDYGTGMDTKTYHQTIALFRLRLSADYPGAAKHMFVFDQTESPNQMQGFIDQIAAGRTLTDEERSDLQTAFNDSYGHFWRTFGERSGQGILGQATKIEFCGETYTFVVPPPPDRVSQADLAEILAHEGNHVIVFDRTPSAPPDPETQAEPTSPTPEDYAKTVVQESRAILAEYAFRLMNNPTPEGLEELRLIYASRVSRLISESPEKSRELYAYTVSPEAFNALVEMTRSYNEGDGPSLKAANTIADAVIDRYAPSPTQISRDLTQIDALIAVRREQFPEDPLGFKNYLAEQPGQIAQRVYHAQDRYLTYMQEVNPVGYQQLMVEGRPLETSAPERPKPIDYAQGVYNIDVELPDGTMAMLGYNKELGRAVLGVNTDGNLGTGTYGYDVFYQVREDGLVGRGTDIIAADGMVAMDKTLAGQFAINAKDLATMGALPPEVRARLEAIASDFIKSGSVMQSGSAPNGSTVDGQTTNTDTQRSPNVGGLGA